MSGNYGARCGLHGCVAAAETLCCEDLGGGHCFGCGIGDLVGDGNPAHGLLIHNGHEFSGWLIREPGSTGLLPFDIVRDINGLPPDELFFEELAKLKGQPMKFNMTVYRPRLASTLPVEIMRS